MIKSKLFDNISLSITVLLCIICLMQNNISAAIAWFVLFLCEIIMRMDQGYKTHLEKEIEILKSTLIQISKNELKAEVVKRDGKHYIKISPISD